MSNGHIHVLGVAGTFMANLAIIAKQIGYKVTGSDQNIYPPMSDILDEQSIEYTLDYSIATNKQFLDSADYIVVGNSLSRGNPCIEYILDSKKRFTSGPEWLSDNLLRDKWVLAVSGTHGKTTTSSMLAWILECNNLNPGYLIGGKSKNFEFSTRITQGKYFVIEADEYDTAFFDKRPKFLHYFPNTLIINNIEYDHADIYNNLDEIEQQFGYLLRTVPRSNGTVVAPDNLYEKLSCESTVTKNIGNRQNPNKTLSEVKYFAITTDKTTLKQERFNNKLVALLTSVDGSQFECYLNNQLLGALKWNCLGNHNVNNALAAIIAANSIGVSIADAIKALSEFHGVARRLEKKAELINNTIVFDDFAHHPTAIKTTLRGVKKHYQHHNIIVIVDFSSFSMRSGAFDDNEFISALDYADKIYLYQADYVTYDCSKLLKKLTEVKQAHLYKDQNKLIDSLVENAEGNEVIIFMTKSDFNKRINDLIRLMSPEEKLVGG